MKKLFFGAIPAVLCALFNAAGAEIPGVPRDSNFNNTGGYDATRIEAQLLVDVKDSTKVVHFIRDNNDPRVVTKTYHIRNVDAYEFRDYLRQMVQAKRVGNTSLQEIYPGNDTAFPVAATLAAPGITTPLSAQPTYAPRAQLGSNTAVECLKYVDGTGLLMISAEEYRFQDHENGMGFDSLVEFLDKPQMGAFFGTQTYFYIPKFVPARNLMPLIQNVGMNVSDVSELWQGTDLVAADPDLNWLLFDVTNYSMPIIDKMLAEYDVPIPQVRLEIKVYEIVSENDQKIGLDFQSWKNNGGIDFFSVGGRYRDNWTAAYGGTMTASGSERTSFYNFNPKWNSRYIDLLVSMGKAKIAHTGELVIRNNSPASLDRTTQVFYMDKTKPAPGTTGSSDTSPGLSKMLSVLIDRFIAESEDYPVAKANQETAVRCKGFGFKMDVSNASVNLKETRFTVSLSSSSLIGFESTGEPRISSASAVSLDVSLPFGKDSFVIGGLNKQETVKSRNGIPWLVNIPYLGWIFGTESTSVKTAQLIVVGHCVWEAPPESPAQPARSKPRKKG